MSDGLVGARELGRWLGVSDRMVRELAERGIIERNARGRYQLEPCVKAYCEHIRGIAAGRSAGADQKLNLTEERALLAREQREAQAIKNLVARKEALPREEVLSRWSTILRNVSARMRAVPSRVRAQRPHLTREDVDLIDEEIRLALTEAADAA
ncbi:hypothetical protein L1787_16570 [Acuticoccus sp. M5D2P5]|uniref:type IV toxin-antitoxin system AbiEi family antitoxin domain-containing protein n=1 Tax=Acuticoccus kalidii TaxID=2910977 RepID=UPI001F39284D|nr:type IV toxin-antitoxin system AbiEi family antitoxin domain-containing protein [Acuticoccus kalidii]MCF3935020.1 hypothetical protein [Acuticoccus kalidii]